MDKKNKLPFKTIVFDMDGTLLNSNKEVLPSTKEILQKLQTKDVDVCIATGRPWYFALKTWKEINSNLPIISCNGALIYDQKLKKILFVNPIKKSAAKAIAELLIKTAINFLIYTSTEMFFHQATKESPWFIWLKNELAKTPEELKFQLSAIDDQFNHNQHDIVKFLIISVETAPEKILDLKMKLKTFAMDTYVLASQSSVLDIMPKGSNKGFGIQVLDKLKYLQTQETISFGDEVNDTPMFEVTKLSVAMGQSSLAIQTKALFTTDNNDQDGIANFFQKHYKI